MKTFSIIFLVLFSLATQATCQKERVRVQVLGSGGPELTDRRASTSYLIWLDDKGIILLDTGAGSMLNYEKSNANPNDLSVVLFSHLHVDHSAEFPALIKGFYFTGRHRDLAVFGPTGNALLPATDKFIEHLFSSTGLYPYLNAYINPSSQARYHIMPKNVDVTKKNARLVYRNAQMALSAVPVHHGPLPALAWKIDIAGCKLVFSGDMNNQFHTLAGLAQHADLLIAHHAIPEQAQGVARQLHMPPSEIGQIAAKAKVKKLVLSHRMTRTFGQEAKTRKQITKEYSGAVLFANDMDIFHPGY